MVEWAEDSLHLENHVLQVSDDNSWAREEVLNEVRTMLGELGFGTQERIDE